MIERHESDIPNRFTGILIDPRRERRRHRGAKRAVLRSQRIFQRSTTLGVHLDQSGPRESA